MILYAAFIFALSSNPNPPSDGDLGLSIPFFDKIAHFFIYFLFGALLYMAVRENNPTHATHISYFAGALYAFSDEFHQYFVPNRSTDPLDFLVDALAIALAIYMCILRENDINEN